jgi:pSer/pThr/pTyr-binding forkhead associated (FHA) protein
MAKLVIQQNGRKIGKKHLSPGMNYIGRTKDQDIALKDESVSRRHARIQVDRTEKIFIYEDLGSLNGSYINRIKANKKLLSKNDIIFIGSHHLHFFPDQQ